jgi:hypothetical protein
MVDSKGNKKHEIHIYVKETPDWQNWVEYRNTRHGEEYPMNAMIVNFVNDGIKRAKKRR